MRILIEFNFSPFILFLIRVNPKITAYKRKHQDKKKPKIGKEISNHLPVPLGLHSLHHLFFLTDLPNVNLCRCPVRFHKTGKSVNFKPHVVFMLIQSQKKENLLENKHRKDTSIYSISTIGFQSSSQRNK